MADIRIVATVDLRSAGLLKRDDPGPKFNCLEFHTASAYIVVNKEWTRAPTCRRSAPDRHRFPPPSASGHLLHVSIDPFHEPRFGS